MRQFCFHSELFQLRQEVIELLADAKLEWLADYSSVDTLQEEYGIEVCGIRSRKRARRVLDLLRRRFPEWPYWEWYCKDWPGAIERGWVAAVQREPQGCNNETWDP